MTRVVVAAVAALLLVLVAAPRALAKPRVDVFLYDVTDAALTEQVDFQGDGGPGCALAGVCGYSGEVSYGFPGLVDGEADILIARQGRRSSAFGVAFLDTNGISKATVSVPGGGPPCTEQTIRQGDSFTVGGTAQRAAISFHSPLTLPNYLDTYCAGPRDGDIWHAGALPPFSVPMSSLRRHRVHLALSSERPFHAGPFSGTVTLRASIRLRRLRAPAGLRRLINVILARGAPAEPLQQLASRDARERLAGHEQRGRRHHSRSHA